MDDPNDNLSQDSSDCSSPEFEFWKVQNPSLSPVNIHSADELFYNGVLLPFQFFHLGSSDTENTRQHKPESNLKLPDPEPWPAERPTEEAETLNLKLADPEPSPSPPARERPTEEAETLNLKFPDPEPRPRPPPPERPIEEAETLNLNLPDPEPSQPPPPPERPTEETETISGLESTTESATTVLTSSRRWNYLFKMISEMKSPSKSSKGKNNKKREKKTTQCGGGNNNNNNNISPDLNIQLRPFTRTRSNSECMTRPNSDQLNRKGGSSIRESESRKWANDPGRKGVQVSRGNPVRKVRRRAKSGSSEDVVWNGEKNGSSKNEVTVSQDDYTTVTGNRGEGKNRVIDVNSSTSNGYKSHFFRSHKISSKNSESSDICSGNSNKESGDSSGRYHFSLRNLFSKNIFH